ncbi:MAG: hypothetical protein ACRCZM_08680 [Bacteroidales bacterium]
MNTLVTDLLDPLKNDLKELLLFKDSLWFWKEIAYVNLLRYLDFAIDETLVKTAQNLLYAYTYSGTMEALVRLCQGLFGDLSTVIVDDIGPAIVGVQIENANTNFLYALSSPDYAVAIDRNFAIAASELAAVVTYDPHSFFEIFLTPGRILKSLDISQGGL